MRTMIALAIALALSQAALARGGGGGNNAGGAKNYEPSGGWKVDGGSSNVRDHRNGASQGGVTVTKGTPKNYHHGGPGMGGHGGISGNPRNPRDHRQ